ncbi:putative DEAD box helicase [Geopyxis carbonaria]|nr:putative DEAD box helicase [Geopyxis carbonaria]
MVDVSTNIIDGPYSSVDDYLETQYDLYREDAVSTIRDGLKVMKAHPHSSDTQHFYVYDHVRLVGVTVAASHGVCYKVSFSTLGAGKRIRWETSTRLTPGTLVCVSSDNFETFRVATVAARPLDGVNRRPPRVDLLFEGGEGLEVDTMKDMLMVEARTGYFESYKWVLDAIQKTDPKKFPLKETICSLAEGDRIPPYVQQNPFYNLGAIFKNQLNLPPVNILEEWPTQAAATMDSSQMEALKRILTKEVAIIQGPPGTGKTYTSVIALHVMLENMTSADPPIVVACQTNHALDQLLRHVVKFESNIIRIGGRTQDQGEILERTLYEARKNSNLTVRGSSFGPIRKEIDATAAQIKEVLHPLGEDLMTPELFHSLGLITDVQLASFKDGRDDWVRPHRQAIYETLVGQWLGDGVEVINDLVSLPEDYEDPDDEYEELQEMGVEFVAGSDDKFDGQLHGVKIELKHTYKVAWPFGIARDVVLDPDISNEPNVWDLDEHLRVAMYCHWRERATELLTARLRDLTQRYQLLVRRLKVAKAEKDSAICARAKLIGMTTTGLSKYRSLIGSLEPRVLMIEEAAEVVEAPILAGCLPTVEHLILVGDHKQLRGKTAVHALSGPPYNLSVSMFERLVENKISFTRLETQRRATPLLRKVLRPIYGDAVTDHRSVLGRLPVQGVDGDGLWWFTHDSPESTADGSPSKVNHFEAAMAVKFAEHLMFNGIKPSSITMLTYYAGQRSLLVRNLRANRNLAASDILVRTVDSYQGEENDIIILSLVRNNDAGALGFLDDDHRLTVALSRAQRGLYIFGAVALVAPRHRTWHDIASYCNGPRVVRLAEHLPLRCTAHNRGWKARSEDCWGDTVGGCDVRCKRRMDCGHVCPLPCHPFDHGQYRCLQPCLGRELACGHPCKRKCYEKCVCAKCVVGVGVGAASGGEGD